MKYFQQTFAMKLIFAKADGWSDGRTSEGSEMQLFACMLPVDIHHISCISEACTTSTCVDGSSTSCCKEVHWSANFIEWGEAGRVEMKQATLRFYCSKSMVIIYQYLSDEHHDSSDEQVCLEAGLMIKRLYHRTVIIPQQVPLKLRFLLVVWRCHDCCHL